jgi:3-oxoacyl-[acyl-carrier protein] reductase
MTADSTVDEINAGGGEAIGIEMDVRDRASVDAMVQKVFDTWDRIDLLVANAGGGRGRPIDTKASTLDSDLLHLVTEMNYYGTVYCVNAVAPIMKAQHSGKIVTVASVAALGPSVDGGYAHYGAAKAAILHYTRYLAQDLGPHGINVNCIAPGTITTGRVVAIVMPNQANANRDRSEQVALRRLGGVEDCAKVVEFLPGLPRLMRPTVRSRTGSLRWRWAGRRRPAGRTGWMRNCIVWRANFCKWGR